MSARRLIASLFAASSALALAAPSAQAQTYHPQTAPTVDTSQVALVNNSDVIVELGAGARARPRFPGSDDYIATVWPIVKFERLNIPGLFTLDRRNNPGGLTIRPSVAYVASRDSGDDINLSGTRALDETYEVGARLGYELPLNAVYGVEVYGELRGAFGEASGVVGGFGADVIARPYDELELKLGPRASLASSDYMSTYFSVTKFESLASFGRLEEFDADGGFTGVGLEASARYEFVPNWFLRAEASYERLVADAKDSPIARIGSRDQFTVGLGLSRRFSFNF